MLAGPEPGQRSPACEDLVPKRPGLPAGPQGFVALADNRGMADPTPQQVREFIAAGLPCSHLEVEGDGRHFFATIVSPEFDGKSRIARHQRVYAALGDRMREQIHALSMKTLTPAEFSAQAHHRS
jgi:acid stress-induced BolA-like protein IbaG/YrbA